MRGVMISDLGTDSGVEAAREVEGDWGMGRTPVRVRWGAVGEGGGGWGEGGGAAGIDGARR